MKFKHVIIGVLAAALCANYVLASDSLITPLFKALYDLQVPSNYEKYHVGIDFFIYLLIFGSALKATIGRQHGIGASFGLSLALSFAMAGFEYRQGFSIGDFWYIALIILGLIIVAWVRERLRAHSNSGWLPFSVAYVVMYFAAKSINPMLFITLNSDYGWLSLVLQMLMIAAVIHIVWSGIQFFRR